MQLKSALRVLLIRALLWAGGAASSSVPLCRLVSELTGDSELKTLSESALVSPGSCIEYKATCLRSRSTRQHVCTQAPGRCPAGLQGAWLCGESALQKGKTTNPNLIQTSSGMRTSSACFCLCWSTKAFLKLHCGAFPNSKKNWGKEGT